MSKARTTAKRSTAAVKAHTAGKPKSGAKAKTARSKASTVRPSATRRSGPALTAVSSPRSSNEDQYGGLLAGLIR